ncbi:serine/threonine-protein kinase [Nonomuraea soli]|uniref:Serine/threonine protein kinase n=1 Tax=Nonomuraea soli TaxID=1032476 RepID=A0A7W0HTG3_9ACTN|nr:serine/threonine-protein kinase [Nonomuraea soli]MBA2895089.1 serine/threonine protein kinase [Nonomuraea soli]
MPLDALRPGDPTVLGPYRLEGRLGRGGQGVVYLGRDPGGEPVAIKVLTGELDRAFARELAAARQVDEFCTARVISSDLDHDPPYVAAEYIDGPALSAMGVLRGAALTRLAIGTATALAAIHRAGVVHRDFKPGNVLMGPDGPRVIDFGIARLVGATVTKDGAAGTPPYMAPEQFTGENIGPPADLFAWGSTMVHAATGRPPFGNDTFAATAHRILHGEPELGELAEPLRSIVARCLSKDPASRPSARQVLLELLGEGATLPAPPTPPGLPAPSGPTASSGLLSRRRMLAGAVAAGAGVAVTGGLLWRFWPTDTASASSGAQPSTGRGTSTPPAGTNPGPSPSASGGKPPSSTPPATPTPTPASDGAVQPPPAEPMALALAIEEALAATSLANLTFDGFLSQSSFKLDATGKVSLPPGALSDNARSDFEVSVKPEDPSDAPFSFAVREGELFMGGKRVYDPPGHDYIQAVRTTAGLEVLLDFVQLAPRVRRSGTRYNAVIPFSRSPEQFKAWIMTWTEQGDDNAFARDTVAWDLRLDRSNRPTRFVVSWRSLIIGQTVSHTFTSVYSRWREGAIQ